MKYPPLPKSVTGLGGAISVEVVESLKDDDGTPCWGLWNQIGRRVRVERSADKRHEWAVLFHELVHAALDDSGVSNLLSEPHVEALCDAIAAARIREKFG